MKSPNIWIGIGSYGDAFLRRAAARHEILKTLGTIDEVAVPILCHFRGDETTDYPQHQDIAYVDSIFGNGQGQLESLVDVGEQRLHPRVRKGNRRGSGYFFIFCHADDLVAVSGIDRSDHWLWKLPHVLDFTVWHFAVLVATEPGRDVATAPDGAGTMALGERLVAISSAMHGAAEEAGSQYQLVVLSSAGLKASFDLPDTTTASIDAATLLFELVGALECDPIESTALTALLEQEPGELEWRPTCTSFLVRTIGVDFDSVASQARRQLEREVQRAIERQKEELEPPERVPDIDIPSPQVPADVDRLTFPFRRRLFDDPKDSRDQLSAAEATLRHDAERLWKEQAWPDLSDTEKSREKAGKELQKALRWLEERIEEAWIERRASAAGVAGYLGAVKTRFREAHSVGASGQRMVTPRMPDFPIQPLEDVLSNMPRAWTALLFLGVLMLGSGAAAYALTEWLSRAVSSLAILGRDWVQATIVFGSMLLIALDPSWRWLLRPARQVDQATRAVRWAANRARERVQALRKEFAEHVAAVAHGDVIARFQQEAESAKQRFEELSVTMRTYGQSEPTPTVHVIPNMHETLTQPHDPKAIADVADLSGKFRRLYVPTRMPLTHTEGEEQRSFAIEFHPKQLPEVLEQFFREEVLGPLVAEPMLTLTPEQCQELEIKALVDDRACPAGQRNPDLIEIFCHRNSGEPTGLGGQPAGVRSIQRVVARGDKYYFLAVAYSLDIPTAV